MPVLNNILAGAAGSGGAADYKIERSLRFDKDGAHLHKNFATASNRKTWTYSTWVKRSALGAEQMFGIERQNGAGHGYEYMRFDTQDRIDLYLTHDGSNWSGRLQTEAVFRDVGAWYHVVLVCDITNSTAGDRIRLYVNGERITTFSASGYPATTEQTTINSTGNHHIGMITGNINYFGGYLAEIHFLDGIAISDPDGVFGEFDAETGAWNPIKYTGSHGTTGFYLDFSDNTSNATLGEDSSGNNNDWNVNNIESGAAGNVDASGYTVTSGPGTGPNDPNRTFNGDTSNGNYAHGYGTHYVHIDTSSSPIALSSTDNLTIWWKTSVTNPRDAILELVINGTARTYTTFSNTGQGNVQSNTVTVGYNGTATAIKLNEASSSSPGELHIQAIQLNGTYLVATQPTDSFRDTPTNYDDGTNIGGNFCTWNSLAKFTGVAGISQPIVYSEGNLKAKISSGSSWSPGCGTIAVNSGKWYAEFLMADASGGNHFHVGINPPLSHFTGVTYHSAAGTGHWYGSNGQMWNNGSAGSVGAVAAANNGDIIGIALDFDASTVTFYKNGTSLTSVSLNSNITTHGAVFGFDLYPTCSVTANWGQRPFANPVSGFKALCTQNIDAPIEKPSKQFDIAIWDGDSASSRTIPTEHEPEFVWVKNRSVNGRSHYLYDAVRGFGANKELVTDDTNEEGSNTHLTQNHGYVSGTTASGFTLAAGATNSVYTNESGQSYVGWVWNAASSTSSVSVGGLNSSVYNQSQNWTNNVSSTSNITSGHEARLFDGNLGTDIQSTQGQSGVINFTSAITGSKIEIYTVGNVGNIGINGNNVSVTSNQFSDTGVTSLTSIITEHPGAGSVQNPAALRVDGKILVDSGVTPPNVPSHACSQRANPTAGFSIVNFLGTNSNISISHGLSQPPEFIVIKSRDSTQPWVIGHKDIGWTHYLRFSGDTAASSSAVWQDTAPTSSVFTVGATGSVNANNENMLALCWHGVEGFSKFGSYIGTGGSPGTYQYTGFKVRFLWLKTVDGSAANWYMYDTERDSHNVTDRNFIPNSNVLEGTTSNKMDFLSNGFIPRSSGTSSNVSGRKYIWCAFADNPLKYARAH